VTRELVASKIGGNPEGKGASDFLSDWNSTQPRGVVAKTERQVLAELFTSMLVLSAAFKYRPVPGRRNYLYWIDGEWSLSLIAPNQWSDKRRSGFAGTCVLQADMTWTITPSDRVDGRGPVRDAMRRFYSGFADMLDTDFTLEEVLPFHVPELPYYQRLHANALSRSLFAAVMRGDRAGRSGRAWMRQLPAATHALLAADG
jgi:hypothetical protein